MFKKNSTEKGLEPGLKLPALNEQYEASLKLAE